MAAGRYGGYRNHELREREFELKSSRRKDYRDHQNDRSSGERDRGKRDLRDQLREHRTGREEREPRNVHHRPQRSGSNSSAGSGSDKNRDDTAQRPVDREPGELSSGSESPVLRDNGARKVENGRVPSPSKKRKFSPIVWDLDELKKSNGVLPPPPPLPQGYVSVRSAEGPLLPPEPPFSPPDVPENHLFSDDPEPGEMEVEDEDNIFARNISTSRWAAGNDALEDEDGVKAEPKMRITPLSNSQSAKQRSQSKLPSPEAGEVILREGSEGAVSRSSHSDGEQRDEQKELDADIEDYMDVDSKEDNDGGSDHLTGTDSESESSRGTSPESPETGKLAQSSVNMLHGCRNVDEFERLNKINEGTYGVVYRARDKKTGEIVALKKVKMAKEREGFPLTSLREINILLSVRHPSIVGVKEVVVGSNLDSIFMVMEYMDHDLKALMEAMKQRFSQSEVKCLMLQLLEGIDHLHDNWVLHRDLKTSNILLNNCGELKICDFGLSRQYGSPLKPYTHLVVTLWYRAPELLLGAKEYSTAIDMWSLGCIMAELLAKEPLFCGKSEVDQLDKIFRTLGTPNETIWPGFTKLRGVKLNFIRQPYNKLREKFPPITSFSGRPTLSEAGFDLLNKLLTYDPEKRITAKDALNHPWFREVPLPKSKEFMPTFPAQNELDRCQRRIMRSPDPLEEQRRKELQQGELGTGGLFG